MKVHEVIRLSFLFVDNINLPKCSDLASSDFWFFLIILNLKSKIKWNYTIRPRFSSVKNLLDDKVGVAALPG
jgi:hypothetical protein